MCSACNEIIKRLVTIYIQSLYSSLINRILASIHEKKETGTHGLGRFIRKGAIDVSPLDCDRRDLAGSWSFCVVGIVLRHVVSFVLRREGRAGSGEDADEERDGDGDDNLAEATAAETDDHLVHLFPARTRHYRLFSSVWSVHCETECEVRAANVRGEISQRNDVVLIPEVKSKGDTCPRLDKVRRKRRTREYCFFYLRNETDAFCFLSLIRKRFPYLMQIVLLQFKPKRFP